MGEARENLVIARCILREERKRHVLGNKKEEERVHGRGWGGGEGME